jgi:hypothetical protein
MSNLRFTMYNLRLGPIVFSLLVLILSSCTKDFIEPNLKDKTVTLLSPQDNFQTTSNTVSFWWEELDGAIGYRLQIVDSAFTSIINLIADTIVEGTQFTQGLQPGKYQWRIKAVNGSSQTVYTTPRTLRIDTTSNISTQSIILISPSGNFYSNSSTNTFKWLALTNADDYRLQVINQNNSVTVVDVIFQTDSFTYTLTEGSYTWQVRAQNSVSNTQYSTRTLNVDLSAPLVSNAVTPAHLDTVSNPVSFLWTRDASASGDSLYIYQDSLLSAPIYTGFHTGTNHSFTGIINQNYFWRLKTRDLAGNWSAYGTLRKFRIE